MRFGRACCLEDLGRIDEAMTAYVDLLTREPTHFGGLTNLGSLLFERGHIAQARPYISAAAQLHPGDPVALVNFAQLQASGDDDFDAAIAAYTSALAGASPSLLHAHLGLAAIYTADRRRPERAQAHLDRAYAEPKAWSFPYRGSGPAAASAAARLGVRRRHGDESVLRR